MAEAIVFNAELRDRAGKGAARAVRRAGRIPAVVYGNKIDPLMISLEPVQLTMQLRKAAFFSTVFRVQVDGQEYRVLARDVQFDPVTDRPLHVDFLRFGEGATVSVEIPVQFRNPEASPGIKRGGVLNIVRREVELACPPESIPEVIEIDLTGLEIGASIHISDVKLPEGVKPTIARDFTIATIAAPSAVKSEAQEAAAAGADEEAPEAPAGGGGESAT